MAIVKTAAKGQVVIPASIRKRYHIEKGTKVEVKEKEGEIILRPLLANPAENAKGMFKKGKSALKALIQDRAEEAKK